MLPRLGIVAGSHQGGGEVVLVAGVRRIRLIGGLQHRDRFPVPACVQIECAQLMVGCEGSWSAGKGCAQPGFGFVGLFRFARRFEGKSFARQVLTGPEDGV